MLEIFIGVGMAVLSLLPKTKFYEGRLATQQTPVPVKSPRITRLMLVLFGLAMIVDGVWRLLHH